LITARVMIALERESSRRRVMRIEYQLTPDDWAAFGEHCGRNAPGFRRSAHVGRVVGIIVTLAAAAILWRQSASLGWLVAGMAAAVAWGWWWPRYLIAHAGSHMRTREQPCLRGRHLMEATPNGLYAECDITKSTVRWSGIAAVAEDDGHIFVMLSDVQGYVIPKREVVSGSIELFLAELNQYRNGPAA
jgi:hypothetical protein